MRSLQVFKTRKNIFRIQQCALYQVILFFSVFTDLLEIKYGNIPAEGYRSGHTGLVSKTKRHVSGTGVRIPFPPPIIYHIYLDA